MPLAAPAEIRGLQVPPIQSIPVYKSSAGEEAIELARLAGLILDPWQQHVLREALGEREDGQWSAFEVGLLVSRQNGKGSIAEARELAGLFLLGERLLLHTAHIFKTSLEGFRRILYLIENTPDLDRRVKRVVRSHGEEGIELKTGQRLLFLARSSGSGRGFSGDCVILDEAMFLGDQVMGALLPTLSARPNPQLWYMSSAGGPESTQLARVVRRGRAGGDLSLAYFEWTVDEGDRHDSPEAWAKANPGLGIRISTEHITREMAAMDFTEFARERLGIGNYPSEEGETWGVIDEPTWNAAKDQRSELVDPVAFAVDVAPDRSFSTISAAGSRADGLRHIEIIEHAPGTGWVIARLAELQERWNPLGIGLDPGGPAGSLITGLENEGIIPFTVGARELAQACGAFYDSLLAPSTIRHQGQMELTAAVKGARQRPLGDAWAWNRRDSSVNLGPLISATIALHVHTSIKMQEPESEVWFMN